MAVDRNTTVGHSQPRSRWQFGLKTLLVTITLVAVGLGAWFSFRPLTVTVTSRIVVIDRAAAEAIYAHCAPHVIEDSPFQWVVLDDHELAELLKWKGEPATISVSLATHTVNTWPHSSYSKGFFTHLPEKVSLGHGVMRQPRGYGVLNGWLGSRRRGGRPQFRVECELLYQHPDVESMSIENATAATLVKEKLFYEGTMPKGRLAFIAPLNKNESVVVVFDVK
jgi:hypothetical protein